MAWNGQCGDAGLSLGGLIDRDPRACDTTWAIGWVCRMECRSRPSAPEQGRNPTRNVPRGDAGDAPDQFAGEPAMGDA